MTSPAPSKWHSKTIGTLLPSATEIVCVLGLEKNLVGIYSNIFKKLFNCRGNGMCGTCLVRIESEELESPNEV